MTSHLWLFVVSTANSIYFKSLETHRYDVTAYTSHTVKNQQSPESERHTITSSKSVEDTLTLGVHVTLCLVHVRIWAMCPTCALHLLNSGSILSLQKDQLSLKLHFSSQKIHCFLEIQRLMLQISKK